MDSQFESKNKMEKSFWKNEVLTEYIPIMLPQCSSRTAFYFYFSLFRSIWNFKHSEKYQIGLSRRKYAITINSICRKWYLKWRDKDRFKIVDYPLKNDNAVTIRTFKQQFPGLKESAVQTFKQKVEKELTLLSKKKGKLKNQSQSIPSKQIIL